MALDLGFMVSGFHRATPQCAVHFSLSLPWNPRTKLILVVDLGLGLY